MLRALREATTPAEAFRTGGGEVLRVLRETTTSYRRSVLCAGHRGGIKVDKNAIYSSFSILHLILKITKLKRCQRY